MKISITQRQGNIPVTVLHLEGALDGATYESLITEAQELYDSGTRDIIFDLVNLTFMSSAGISALHHIALLYRGEKQMVVEDGWSSYRAIDRDRDNGFQIHLKLLNPPDKVLRTLEMVGFTSYFEIHTDLNLAVASFQ
jgi:anti-anti-sigma factor